MISLLIQSLIPASQHGTRVTKLSSTFHHNQTSQMQVSHPHTPCHKNQLFIPYLKLHPPATPSLPPPNHLHNNHIRQRIRLHPPHLEPRIRPLHHPPPSLQTPLPRIKQRHHPQIRARPKLRDAPRHIGIDIPLLPHIIDEQDSRPGFERGNQIAHDGDGFGVGPVVED